MKYKRIDNILLRLTNSHLGKTTSIQRLKIFSKIPGGMSATISLHMSNSLLYNKP